MITLGNVGRDQPSEPQETVRNLVGAGGAIMFGMWAFASSGVKKRR
ncbi:hypothetical protein V5P93_000887 [Actinokineospora auranticolor]|uniref:Uncharacterized protein n=1 Tax=Actinokineospora auranticolor TaxID=155976 RepID=A0A2S6GYC8_9PSEU|nr:hypothetical protein [Actinokineospora auranticolor]PPK70235.1 hypothetical protein CLV40_102146 [Actinokineospora auranticolor]